MDDQQRIYSTSGCLDPSSFASDTTWTTIQFDTKPLTKAETEWVFVAPKRALYVFPDGRTIDVNIDEDYSI